MPPVVLAQIEAATEADTVALAVRMAALAKPGDILLLSGDLGAGKTAFARAFIQSTLATEDRTEDVPSPTFTLVQTYATARFEIWHADLYRLSDASELWELGLLEAGAAAVLLVEWPEVAEDAWPGHALWLRFETSGPDSRSIALCRVDGRDANHTYCAAFTP